MYLLSFIRETRVGFHFRLLLFYLFKSTFKVSQDVIDMLGTDRQADRVRLDACIEKLEKVGTKFGVDFVISASVTEADLSDFAKTKILISL